jgi:hypothetical protein
MTRTGQCLCGKLKYQAEGEPLTVGNCYCTDCRRETGSGHTVWLIYPAANVSTEGEIKTFSKSAESGQIISRVFCPECGTTIFGEPTTVGEVRAVRAGTLDDTTGISPAVSAFVGSACSWDRPSDDVPQFAGMDVWD